jgi:hypothetical protein
MITKQGMCLQHLSLVFKRVLVLHLHVVYFGIVYFNIGIDYSLLYCVILQL